MLSIQRGCREESTAVETGGKNTGFPKEHMFTDMNPYMRGLSWLDKGRDTHTHILMQRKETPACRITGWDQRQVLAKCGSCTGLLLTDKCGWLAQRFTAAATVKLGSHTSHWQRDVLSRQTTGRAQWAQHTPQAAYCQQYHMIPLYVLELI